MTDRWTERLSEHLDGELRGADRAALEAHLADCPDCVETLAELGRVAAAARALPSRPPESDLWPGIAARLAPRPAALPARDARPRRRSPSLPQLAAAGLAIALLSGGAVWLAMRPVAPPPAVESRAAVAADAAAGPFDESVYDAAAAELERALRENRGRLDTATVRVIEQNLEIVDRALEEIRRALRSDPANPYLNGHLAEQMKRKIRLLQRATGVVAAHG